MMGGMVLLLLGTTCLFPVHAAAQDAASNEIELGRRIYQEGLLPSGAPLSGVRNGGSEVSGTAAACATCHRRSGMGSVEGDLQVPPITGKALFGEGGKVIVNMDPRSGKAWNQKHDPYTEETLAKAVQKGVNNGGRDMSTAMPRYALGEPEMKALSAYLRQLSKEWSPGVTADAIRFATVITPDVAPERKQALLDMMRAAFVQKNASTVSGHQPGGRRHMVTGAEMVLGTERRWQLDVWELQGAPETWAAQLDDHYRRQPVFALVSGLSTGTWEPVHDFCEREHVPCWFPSVDLPPATQGAFYPVYFSEGVTLEAEVLARHLRATNARHPRRLIQVYRDDLVGRSAAQALSRALAGSGIKVEGRPLDEASPKALRHVVADIRARDAVMFWLRPADLRMLGDVTPPAGTIYFSARLAEDEDAAFSPRWKRAAHLVYPYELPQQREASLAYFHQWLKLRDLPLVDEPMQSEVYFSLNFLTDTLAEMLDNLYRDYLMERAESMISRRENSKAEEEAWARDSLRQPARNALIRASVGASAIGAAVSMSGKREGTTIYPRLSLGPTQRIASKGGYIVRFANNGSDDLVAETGWIVP
jgi:mono/diheme cytochrome c family protein